MSEHTRFRLNLPNFSIELAGERSFVEELYRKVYRDLLPLIEASATQNAQPMSAPEGKPLASGKQTAFAQTIPVTAAAPPPHGAPDPNSLHRNDYTWIYNCTSHYNKVYVIENQVILHSFYGRFLNPQRIRRIYIDRDTKSTLFKPLAAGNRTLWAEITPEGRRMIEEAAQKRRDQQPKP
jgi:hypothetical protein